MQGGRRWNDWTVLGKKWVEEVKGSEIKELHAARWQMKAREKESDGEK